MDRKNSKTTRDEKMGIIQANVGRSRGSHDMAQKVAMGVKAEIIVVCEPNKGVIKNWGWIRDNSEDVAVRFLNKGIKVRKIEKRQGFLSVDFEDWRLVACYASPNASQEAFSTQMEALMTVVQAGGNNTVLVGDFNAKAREWGSARTDARGREILEHVARLGLIIINDGLLPTFVRGASTSYIDLTMASGTMARRLSNWRVLDEESLSLHKFVAFEVAAGAARIAPGPGGPTILNKEVFRTRLLQHLELNADASPEACRVALIEASRTNKRNVPRRRAPYWWSEEVENAKRNCDHARRVATRANRRGYERAEEEADYTAAKRTLRLTIRASKREKWRDLCRQLDEDIWGDGYRLVTRSIGAPPAPYRMSDEMTNEVVNGLFTAGEEFLADTEEGPTGEPFSMDELRTAARKIRVGRAAGPDRIAPEVVREAVEVAPDYILQVMNGVLDSGNFPEAWGTARLVLIQKSGKPEGVPTSYRPLCLLNGMSKLYEHLLRERIATALDLDGGLAENQYGFRAGRSTIQAIQRVVEQAEKARQATNWCAVVALDVANAFNTTPWDILIRRLRERHIPVYLVNAVIGYLRSRRVQWGPDAELRMCAGVPQGSVIGPLLWNIYYDSVLRIPLPRGVDIVGFADDLAVVTTASDSDVLIQKTNEVLRHVSAWTGENGLTLAPHKSEAVIMAGKRNRGNVVFRLGEEEIVPKKTLTYLGVKLDDMMTFGPHIRGVAEKAGIRAEKMARILPNIGGARSNRRAILGYMVNSIMLYAAPVWANRMAVAAYRLCMERVQRRMLLRIASAYRTVSNEALQVLTGFPPIDLMVIEKKRIHETALGHSVEVRREQRNNTVMDWNARWTGGAKAQWTRQLIPELTDWTRCSHKSMDFHITQCFTQHGSFGVYLKKMGKTDQDSCRYCDEVDTAEHTLFSCPRWGEHRRVTELEIGRVLTVGTMVPTMLESRAKWNVISKMMKEIMRTKEADELQEQAEARERERRRRGIRRYFDPVQ